MEFYIRIKDGQPFEHPIAGENFCQAFPHVDTNNLPPEFAKFIRVDVPDVGAYEVYDGVTYELVDGAYKDVHHIRVMTSDEKATKIAKAKLLIPPEGWIFNEATCKWQPTQE